MADQPEVASVTEAAPQVPAREKPSPTVMAHRIGDIILETKGSDLVILDVEDITTLGDYVVIASGNSGRQLQAMAMHIIQECKTHGLSRCHAEGMDQGWWILIDCGDVIVHVMQEEARRYYDLEMLWSDAKVVRRSAHVA